MTKHDRELIRACWRWILALTQGRADASIALYDIRNQVERAIKADPRHRRRVKALKK